MSFRNKATPWLYGVNDLYPCIQGEGLNTGLPMVMIRLQGCGVGCPWCDTKETWDGGRGEVPRGSPEGTLLEAQGKNERWAKLSGEEIADIARGRAPALRWALLSGGEPAEWDLRILADRLRRVGFKLAIETSGTVTAPWLMLDHVTLSPKIGMPGGREVLDEVIQAATEIKFPIGKPADVAVLDAFLSRAKTLLDGDAFPMPPVLLQPLSQSEAATELCVKTCLERGFRLSIQAHKYLELP